MAYENIKCRIFKGWESDMNILAAGLGGLCRGGVEKTRLADKLRLEADSLLACPDYDDKIQDCGNCRAIAARRKCRAELNSKKKIRPALYLAGNREYFK